MAQYGKDVAHSKEWLKMVKSAAVVKMA